MLNFIIMTIMGLTFSSKPFAQHFSSARAIGVGGFTSLAADVSALDWNPAGLTSLNDWNIGVTNFYSPSLSNASLSFTMAGVSKTFGTRNDHSAAFRISPGIALEFVVPTTFELNDSLNTIKTEFDKKISYQEHYALGYAFQLHERSSLGFSAHYIEERINDTEYSLDTNSTLRSAAVEYTGSWWSLDWGVLWRPTDTWQFGAVAKNLFRITEKSTDAAAEAYSLQLPKSMRFGASYSGLPSAIISADGDFEKQFRFGGEYRPSSFLQLQAGLYTDASDGFRSDAVALGIGASLQTIQLDLSYLKFLSQDLRKGTATFDDFLNADITSIEYTPFTSDRISLTARLQLGRTRDALARIEYVEILSDVYPASQSVYAFRPIGKARIRNVSNKSIDARISFFVDNLMDRPTETKPYSLAPNDVLEVPFYAIFSEALRAVSSLLIENGEIYVRATAREDYDDRYQARILVRGRNDWNGDVAALRYFVTPDDPDVVRFSREVLSNRKTHLDTLTSTLQILEKARLLFSAVASRTTYVNDPKKSQDHVQYPGETLSLRGGDCDDMTVLMSALLASAGISSAFVDVIPPDQPEEGHIYLMFDTGIDPSLASNVSENPKRYVVRANESGKKTIWIPLETTVLTGGFDAAWEKGAQEYFDDAEVGLGLIKGWLRIVDLEFPG